VYSAGTGYVSKHDECVLGRVGIHDAIVNGKKRLANLGAEFLRDTFWLFYGSDRTEEKIEPDSTGRYLVGTIERMKR
jgi:hypothetical protein